ncbi:MAG: hypothetical protein QM820_14150 [Minicystis sp.]
MIRIVRGPEPQEVIDAREEHLSFALLDPRDEGPEEITGYDVAKPRLYERQFSKCAYCESWEREESQPTEHFRPKGRPMRIDWTGMRPVAPSDLATLDEQRFARGLPPTAFDRVRWPEPSRQPNPERGYWWLAWTWENLVFGCQSCNGKSCKGSRFPLARGSAALGLHEQPPAGEQALLIDPTDPRVDPMDLIRFRWNGKHWRPFAVNDDARAAWTIEVFRLAGPSLLTAYTIRIASLEQQARALRNALADGRPAATIHQEWTSLRDTALAPGESYLALGHDWLAATFATEIQRFGLTLARPFLQHPGAAGGVAPEPPLPSRPALAGLPERLQYRVRAARHHQGPAEVLRALIVDVCRERPFTTAELVTLLGRPTAIPGYLRELEGHALLRDEATERWRLP